MTDMKEWRQHADESIERIAKSNQLVMSGMVIGDLERRGYGLKNYSPLGPALQAAARNGIIKKIMSTRSSNRTSTVWESVIYKAPNS